MSRGSCPRVRPCLSDLLRFPLPRRSPRIQSGFSGKSRIGLEPPMIFAKDLTRKYGNFTAVENVSFKIPDGQVVGLLGHNGAGKTTIMKMLTGFLEPTSGSVTIDGHRRRGPSRRQAQGADRLSAGELPALSGNDRHRLPRLCRRAARRRRPTSPRSPCAPRSRPPSWAKRRPRRSPRLSRGFRQRVGVAQAILHKPKIIILDEPTNGLDPTQIRHMRCADQAPRAERDGDASPPTSSRRSRRSPTG